MLRSAPRLLAVFLCGAALCGCASSIRQAVAPTPQNKAADATDKNLPTDVDSGVAQAKTLRLAGHYDDAVHILSQLMLVASDDPRLVAEYGKSLVGQGRAQEATEFLNRAVELSSNDWTLYSAMGVADDQLGNQAAARTAYEHALALKPNEPSVLNNYALSRMLANDADGARILIARAQAAGGATDSKIAANITMISKLAPTKPDAVAAIPKAPVNNTAVVQNAPPPAPARPVVTASQQPAAKPAQNIPRALGPTPAPGQTAIGGVVMQAVPADPLAGPVKPATPKPKAVAKTDTNKNAKTADVVAPVIVIQDKPATKAKAQPAQTKDAIPALRLTADARNP